MNSSVKRKRAGGQAISGSTKRQSAAWREELAEDDGDDSAATGAPAAAPDIRVALGLSEEEEEIMDPGTPLSSEEEPRAPESEVVAATAVSEPSAAAGTEETQEDSTAAAGPDAQVPDEPAGPTGPAPTPPAEAASIRPSNGMVGQPTLVWLELVSGEDGDDERASEPLELLLREGLTAAVRERLRPCLPPGRGSPISALVPGLVCTFAGHGSLDFLQRPEEPSEGAEATAGARLNGEKTAGPVLDAVDPASARLDKEPDLEVPEALRHSSAGLLTAPRDAPGLALTLGHSRQLDATHDVLGPVLLGRRVVQQLGALAPRSGGPAPARPLSLRVVPSTPVEAPSSGSEQRPDVPVHPKTAVSPVPLDSRPYLLEETPDPPIAEELETLGIGLDTREAEAQELKQQVFSRERQEGVLAVEAHLADADRRVQELKAGTFPAEEKEALEAQLMWMQERIRHLVRLITKLK